MSASNAQPNPLPDITCSRCNKTGHFSNKCHETKHADGTVLILCPDTETEAGSNSVSAPTEATALATIGEEFVQEFFFLNNGEVNHGVRTKQLCDDQLHGQHKALTGCGVPDWWISFDNQSTVDVFCNRGSPAG